MVGTIGFSVLELTKVISYFLTIFGLSASASCVRVAQLNRWGCLLKSAACPLCHCATARLPVLQIRANKAAVRAD